MATGIAHEIDNPPALIREQAGWMRDLLEGEELRQNPNHKEYKASFEKILLHVERA